MESIDKKKLVEFFIARGILITPDILESIESIKKKEDLFTLIEQNVDQKEFMVLNKDIQDLLKPNQKLDANWTEFEKSRTLSEKKSDGRSYVKFVDYLKEGPSPVPVAVAVEAPSPITIKFSYDLTDIKKREYQDFVCYFNSRFADIERMLSVRSELTNLMSINRVNAKKERDTCSIIGIVAKKEYTKNKNLILELEDPTGRIKVLVNANKPDLFEQAKDIVLDEIIGVVGSNGDNILFSNALVWPDVPLTKELKKASEEAYAIFLSDIHVGSNTFLKDDFEKFLKWLRGEAGNDAQREIADKTKYIFIVGDLVDGVGIYPGQEEDLIIKDIFEQYKECARYLDMIPKDKQIIICPGNHDAMRIAEPQMVIYADMAAPLFELPNITMVSNPGIVNIHGSDDFPGFDVLLYHGYSFDYYAREVESIRNGGGYDRADLLMKFLLKRRHLAPTHTSTLYSPDVCGDSLVIKNIPDFFITGHIHKCAVSSYRNVTLVCGSCWQAKTAFQEKVGHNPEPSRVPIVNLKTRDMKIMKFGD
jgi:DNA polymerase II small subunit